MIRRGIFIMVFVMSLVITGFTQKVTLVFKIGTTSNSCNFYVPSGTSKPPVVFFIHGANGSGGDFETETKGDAVADKEKFIAVYPSASSSGGGGIWNDMSGTTNFPFFQAVLDTLDKRYQIDRNKVYMTGFSQGGFISFVAGCKYSDIFAAVAPVSGHAGSPCALKRPVSVFMTFGGQEGASSFLSDLNIWLKLDSCPSTPTVTRPYPASSPQSGVTRVSYGPCAQGSYVIMDSISGEGHQWPAANRLNQAEEVWAFFKQFSLQKLTAVQQKIASMAREPVSALYASGSVRLQGVEEKCGVKVIDTKGRLVISETAIQRQFSFKNKPSGVYMVMVSGNDRTGALKIVIP